MIIHDRIIILWPFVARMDPLSKFALVAFLFFLFGSGMRGNAAVVYFAGTLTSSNYSDSGSDLGNTGYWFANFNRVGGSNTAPPNQNEVKSLPAYASLSFGPTIDSAGGFGGYADLTLPNGQVGNSGALEMNNAPGNVAGRRQTYLTLSFGSGVPEKLRLGVVIDNSDGLIYSNSEILVNNISTGTLVNDLAPDVKFFDLFNLAPGNTIVVEGISSTASVSHLGGFLLDPLHTLDLEVNSTTGWVRLLPPTGVNLDVKGYSITSSGESLNPTGWSGLENTSLGNGDPTDGVGWEKLGAGLTTKVGEYNLTGDTTFGPSGEGEHYLGQLFVPGSQQDLRFQFTLANGTLYNGAVKYISGAGPGDYNANGTVDAADYVLWRDMLNSTGPGRVADGDGNEIVNDLDYAYWKRRFGNIHGSGSGDSSIGSQAIPEPSALLLFVAALVVASCYFLRRINVWFSIRSESRSTYRGVLYFTLVGFSTLWTAGQARALTLGLEPLITGIDRPSHVAQAPGDPGSLYVIEQRAGRIINVNLTTGVRSTVLTFTGFDTTIEGGVHTMAFHPQFEQNGLFYVSWLEDGGTGIGDYGNVDEFQLVGGVGEFSQRILRHQIRDASSTHGLDWVGFDPTATGDAQNYLYITTGDGGFDGAQLQNDFSQDLSTRFGKVMRVDVRTDEFPGDPNRNFAIPPDNPYANDGNPNTLGEVFLSGLRNPWRMTFDRNTGDMFIGDVGQGSREEINFVKAGESGIDFGWNAYEGTINRGKASLHPNPRFSIYEYAHTGGNVSVTGGYVYRGPIEELDGTYFFADFNTSNVWSGVFNRDTDPTTFNGANLSVTSRTAELNGNILGSGQLGHIVSFGEDLAGNLLFVDYGQGNLFNPTPNTGVIYRLLDVDGLIPGDLNEDTFVTLEDWALMKAGFLADLSGLTSIEKFRMGDLNWDGRIDLHDFDLFSIAYANGPGAGSSGETDTTIPEPSGFSLIVLMLFAGRAYFRRIRRTSF